MARLPITKTPKVFVGGQFIRSESGRVFPIQKKLRTSDRSQLLGNIPQCTRKDLRNAVEAAAKAGPDWAHRTPYNRGQIIYRLGEMVESRSAEMADALVMSGVGTKVAAAKEVSASVDRLIYYAGWADKYEQVLGNTNPVAGPFFNFTVAEPMGIIGVIADDDFPLLGLLSQIAPVILSGNTVVCLASETYPYPAIVLGEMLAVSDLPGGVVNILTGFRKELVPTFATHTHIRGVSAVVDAEEKRRLQLGAAESIKRVRTRSRGDKDPIDRVRTRLRGDKDPIDRVRTRPREGQNRIAWESDKAQSLYEIRDFVEFKTTWHPIGA